MSRPSESLKPYISLLFRLGIPAEPNSSKAAAAKLHFSVQGRQNLASEVAYSDLGTSTERPVTTITQESTADSSGRLKRQKESWSEELASLKH